MPGGFHPTLKVIASWPKPNYVDPETQGRELFAISISLSFIATVVVILRLLVRIRIQRQVGPDDLLLTLGLVCSFPIYPLVVGSTARQWSFLAIMMNIYIKTSMTTDFFSGTNWSVGLQ